MSTTRKKIIHALSYALFFFFAFFILVMIKAWLGGKFQSVETFQEYISEFGFFAPIVLTLFQAAQVVIPVLPGFFGCGVGAIMFGWLGGFLCNYIGISAGSIIAFFLARKFGYGFVKDIFKSERYDKWITKAAESKSYAAFLFVATLLPFFPDDFLCYFSGITDMTAKRFSWIIVLGKPWCILAYSIVFGFIK